MPENKNKQPDASDDRAQDTVLVHDERHDLGAVAPPIYQSSLFTFASYADFLARYRGESAAPVYSRVDNPTVRQFELKLAALEETDDALAFASGMAAISSTILSVAESGDRVVCVNHVYPDAYRFLLGPCHKLGIETQFVDGDDLDAITAALPGARLLYLESPTSWVMREQDLRAIAELAKQHGVVTAIDNTWATPLFQQPATHGIDLVIHSVSKYLSGHSDVVAGVVAGSHERIGKLRNKIHPYLGGKLSAHEAGLILRGLRTLSVRMERHQKNGTEIAQKLVEHPHVTRVHHPALRPAESATLKGYSSLFSFEVSDDVDVPTFCDALSLFRLGVSWGGYESLVVPAAIALEQNAPDNPAKAFGISDRLIRLHVGLEDANELWADLEAALAAGANRR